MSAATPPPARGEVERFTRGDPLVVDVERVEHELTALWMEASRAGDTDHALIRAALWNLIVPATSGPQLQRARAILNDLSASVPARALVLSLDGAGQDQDDEIRATIESNVVSRSGGARTVYAEEITLAGPAGAGDRMGVLVRALQIPGLPTATLWLDNTMPESLLRGELLPSSDRLVLDTATCPVAAGLEGVRRFADEAREARAVADLGWLRLASFRLLFAGLFDPPVGGEPLRRARRVVVRYRGGAEVSALLLAAWLGVLLDWQPRAAVAAGAPGARTFRAERPDGAPIELTLLPSPGACGTSGIIALELAVARPDGPGGADDVFAVRRTEQGYAELTHPIAPPKMVKLDSRTDAELCAAALGPAGRDKLFARCLAYAAQLVELQAG